MVKSIYTFDLIEIIGGVFGIPLEMSIKYAKTTVGYVDDDGIKHTKAGAIPIIVAKCGSYIKKNGLYSLDYVVYDKFH